MVTVDIIGVCCVETDVDNTVDTVDTVTVVIVNSGEDTVGVS